MKKILTTLLFISIFYIINSLEISPDEYILGVGDSVEVYVVDSKGVNSFSFVSQTLDDGSFILMAPTTNKTGFFDVQTQIFLTNFKSIGYKNLTRKDFQDSILKTYRREFVIDTVLINIKYYGSHSYINVTTNLDSTRFVNFEWGKNFLYYLSHVQTKYVTLIDSSLSIYTIRKGKNFLEKVSPYDIVYPGDRIYLKPQAVGVVGQVVNGGMYPYSPDLTVKEYISLAGGPTIDGDINNIKHFDKKGKKKTGQVEPEDILVVEKSLSAKMKDMSYFVSVIMNSILIYVYISNIFKK